MQPAPENTHTHGLTMAKAHRTAAEVAKLSNLEQQHWRGNDRADCMAKQAVQWHNECGATNDAVVTASRWSTKLIVAVGSILAELPTARELYKR